MAIMGARTVEEILRYRCDFCGTPAKYHFKTGKRSYCCSTNVSQCPEIKRQNSEKARLRTGRIHSEETKEKIRQGNLGKIVSDKTREKLRKPKPDRHKENLRKARIGRKDLVNKGSFKKGIVPWNKDKKGLQVAWNKGIKRSEETRTKISETRRKRLALGIIVITEETKRKIGNAHKGSKRSLETREKQSLAASGENSSQWRGGIASEPYCNLWLNKDYKKYIYERDNYECQNPYCSGSSERICRHHIDYNKKNCDPMNIITLCISCNSRANANRDYWIKLYRRIVNKRYASIC